MIHNLPHNYQSTLDVVLYYSGHTMLRMIKNRKVVGLFFCGSKIVFKRYNIVTDS